MAEYLPHCYVAAVAAIAAAVLALANVLSQPVQVQRAVAFGVVRGDRVGDQERVQDVAFIEEQEVADHRVPGAGGRRIQQPLDRGRPRDQAVGGFLHHRQRRIGDDRPERRAADDVDAMDSQAGVEQEAVARQLRARPGRCVGGGILARDQCES